MAVAAEIWQMPEETVDQDQALVILVPEMLEDELTRKRAERFIRGVGSTALQHEIVVSRELKSESDGKYQTLMDAIHAAAEGDDSARPVIEANVRSDVIERGYKAGHVMRVELSANDDGKIGQHGQQLEDVYANSLRFITVNPKMRERVEAETRNGFRLEALRRQGLLKDYNFVVFSAYPDYMSDEVAGEIGFFVDTKSCVIQTVSEEDDRLFQESAFVAGVKTLGAEPHYQQTLLSLSDELGVPIEGKSATEIIDSPMLIHKSLMPNGVVDLVKMYDQKAEGTFFGETKPRQDYLEYLEICRAREAKFEPTVQSIVDDLKAEANWLRTPLDATKRLHTLSQRILVDCSFEDYTINPRVFGAEAARHIEEGRRMLERGEIGSFLKARNSAQSTARSSSCPNGFSPESAQTSSSSSSGEKKKMTCPFCGDKNQYGDPCSPNQHCKACGAKVVEGKVASKGDSVRKPDKSLSRFFGHRERMVNFHLV